MAAKQITARECVDPNNPTAAEVAAQAIAAEKKNAKIKPSLIMVDNAAGGQDAVLQVIDRFTPSVTNGVDEPVVTEAVRLAITVVQEACVSLRDELKDLIILGAFLIRAGTTDTDCYISAAYDFE